MLSIIHGITNRRRSVLANEVDYPVKAGVGVALNKRHRTTNAERDMTTLTLDFQPQRMHHIVEYEVEDELTLYDPRTEVVHILNPSAAIAWRLCDGNRRLSDISTVFAEVYAVVPEVAEQDVNEVLAKFVEAGLLR